MRHLPFLISIVLLISIPACSLTSAQTSIPTDPRADFLKLIDRPHVPPDPQLTPLPSADPSIAEFHLTISADPKNKIPALLLIPKNFPAPRPCIICLHGTGGSKSSMLPFMQKLAAKGFIAIAPDGPYHGERSAAGKGEADYEAAILAAYNGSGEHPFFYDTVFDTMRLIDYLQTRPDIDPLRIGLYGVSKGGIETYLTAAVDPRVAAAVPCIGMESFRWAEDNNAWQHHIETIPHAFAAAAKESNVPAPDANFVHTFYNKIAPGLDAEFDGPSMAPLIAPRPLFIINGELDPRNPLPALKLCTDAATAKYHATHADQNLQILIEPNTPHKVIPAAETAAIDFFVAHLTP